VRCLDGVCDRAGHFTAIAAPSIEQMEKLCTTIAERVQRLLVRRAIEHDEPTERALRGISTRPIATMWSSKPDLFGRAEWCGAGDSQKWTGTPRVGSPRALRGSDLDASFSKLVIEALVPTRDLGGALEVPTGEIRCRGRLVNVRTGATRLHAARGLRPDLVAVGPPIDACDSVARDAD
jgi:hypothetical protein